jgi:hypothetical protein
MKRRVYSLCPMRNDEKQNTDQYRRDHGQQCCVDQRGACLPLIAPVVSIFQLVSSRQRDCIEGWRGPSRFVVCSERSGGGIDRSDLVAGSAAIDFGAEPCSRSHFITCQKQEAYSPMKRTPYLGEHAAEVLAQCSSLANVPYLGANVGLTWVYLGGTNGYLMVFRLFKKLHRHGQSR